MARKPTETIAASAPHPSGRAKSELFVAKTTVAVAGQRYGENQQFRALTSEVQHLVDTGEIEFVVQK